VIILEVMDMTESVSIQPNRTKSLNIHIKFIDSGVVSTYSCAVCTFQTQTKQHLLTHEQTEHEEQTFEQRASIDIEGGENQEYLLGHHETEPREDNLGILVKNEKITKYKVNKVNPNDEPSFSKIIKKEISATQEDNQYGNKPSEESFNTKKIKYENNDSRQKLGWQTVYNCDRCESVFMSDTGLKMHFRSIHEGIRFNCDQCSYTGRQSGDVKRHKEFKHNGVKLSCSLCSYQTGWQSDLKVHHQSKHEGISYSCDLCDYETGRKNHLKAHKQYKHEKITYPCSQCTHEAKTRSHLKSHEKSKHAS